MIFSNWILLFPILSLFPRQALSSSSSINLIASYSSQNLVLICELRGNENSNIYLKCPFTNSGICNTNCKSDCEPKNSCLPMILSCSSERVGKNHIMLKWSIDITRINKSGAWRCSHRNVISNSILLENYVAKTNITTFTKKESYIQTTTSQVPVVLPPQIETKERNLEENNLFYHNTRNDFWQFITQPNIVLVLVCVFSVSLVMNIIFLIRCSLFRSVIDNYLKEKKAPNSCLFKCFCIPTNINLPPVNMKSLHQNNPSACMGYHRDDIYDDMSSGSQADRHLINNYSHYELEHESLRSRKVWSTDGSHNVISRQSHICPGQPVGNYVIVAGPVCTNRNHIPLNTPSNASLASNSQHTYTTDAMNRSLSNEFQRPEYCTGTDNVIYSQPLKNRTKSFDPAFNDEVSIRYIQNFKQKSPPPPPERCSAEQNQHTNVLNEPTPINAVDLIEHYTHSTTTAQSPDNKDSIMS